MKQVIVIKWFRQGSRAKHGHKPVMAGVLLAGMLIFEGLVVSLTGLAEEKTEDILTKVTPPIKYIADMRELERATFHVINITEHDSVLPAELRLAGKESDWAEGVRGLVDGKEVPTGLLPGDKDMRLMVLVPLKPKESKKVSFKKGKGAASSDLKLEQDSPRVVVANRQASWTLGPNGLEQFQRKGKTFGVQEAGISNGTLKATVTPAVCRVTLQKEGAAIREYLFYPNASLWQVNAGQNYQLTAGGTNAFYYSHPCSAFFCDPGSPYGAVIQTDELEKGGAGVKGLKEFHLFSAVDWGMLMDNDIGLGIYPNPSSFTILVDTTNRTQGVVVQAVPIDERSNSIFKKWHWGLERESSCGCGWWRTQTKPLGNTISYVFSATVDVKEGTVQRSGSLAPLVFRSLGARVYGAQFPWITTSRSEMIQVDDLDGNGLDMLNDCWSWCDNGKPMSRFEFSDSNKDGRLDDVYIYANWNDKGGPLDPMELKYPVCALHDQTRDGKIVANCVFFGGRVDRDWFETSVRMRGTIEVDGSETSNRKMMEQKSSSPLEARTFSSSSRALDLDGDGDVDVVEISGAKDLDTDYQWRYGRSWHHVDMYDNNPFHGVLLDPLSGNFVIKSGFQWPFYLGEICGDCFRYKGVSVNGQDAVVGNICLDGDGLPEGKLIYDGGLIGEDFLFRPVQNMIGSSLYLSNRHAMNKINSWIWQESPSGSCNYRPDVGLFPIRKNAGCPYLWFPFKSRLMPKRPAKDNVTTYRDKWGNKIRVIGIGLPASGWDGRFVVGSKTPAIVNDWSDSIRYDWDYLLAGFEGPNGVMTESGYPNSFPRREFCPDYAKRRQTKLFYSELDGRLHLTGAAWGHRTPYGGTKKLPLDEIGNNAQRYLNEGLFCLDCDFMRYYATRHEVFFDEDGDGYLDCFLVDGDNDGWFEDRAWYDRSSRTVSCLKNGIMVLWPRQLEPYPEEELLVDAEHYDKLVALKRMSEEKTKTSFLNATTIKTTPLTISVQETNLWVGIGGEWLPQVLLDAAHCEAGIWRDLSPKGYSRLLTGLQRQKVVVRELREKWSAESLREASVLFLAPPHKTKPDADELKALDAFLKRGGRVVMAFPDWSTEPKGEVYAMKTDKALVPGDKGGEWISPLGVEQALKWEEPEPYRVRIHVSPRWDQTHFYLYAEVHDRNLINKETGVDIWSGDSIQFALGNMVVPWQDLIPGMGDGELRTRACVKGEMRQEYGIARTDKGAEIYRWIDIPGNRAGPVANAKLQVTREGNRTVYQLALPWSEVGQTNIQSGATLGFAVWVWDLASNGDVQRMMWGHLKRPNQFRRLILVDRPDAAKTQAGASVESLLDAMCASYGIRRNHEQTVLVAVIDPHFRNRGLGPEVWERFKGGRSDGIMKNVRKLFFNGSSLDVSGAAEPVIGYQNKTIGARAGVGKGELLVFCSEMMLNNKCSCFYSFASEGGDCPWDEPPLDKLLDAKPDNNVFMDNLARYLVADQQKVKVLKAGEKQMTVELAGPGQVYVNKGVKLSFGNKETISSKEDGGIVRFEIPASKVPIKVKIAQ